MTRIDKLTALLKLAAPHCPQRLRDRIEEAMNSQKAQRPLDVAKIRQQFDSGRRVHDISEELGVSRNKIARILRGAS